MVLFSLGLCYVKKPSFLVLLTVVFKISKCRWGSLGHKLNPSPYLKAFVEQSSEAFGVAYCSGSGFWHAFKRRDLTG